MVHRWESQHVIDYQLELDRSEFEFPLSHNLTNDGPLLKIVSRSEPGDPLGLTSLTSDESPISELYQDQGFWPRLVRKQPALEAVA